MIENLNILLQTGTMAEAHLDNVVTVHRAAFSFKFILVLFTPAIRRLQA
jgi:hypothetical protein